MPSSSLRSRWWESYRWSKEAQVSGPPNSSSRTCPAGRHHLTGSPGKRAFLCLGSQQRVSWRQGQPLPAAFISAFVSKELGDALVDSRIFLQNKRKATHSSASVPRLKTGPKLITLVREHQVSLEDRSQDQMLCLRASQSLIACSSSRKR